MKLESSTCILFSNSGLNGTFSAAEFSSIKEEPKYGQLLSNRSASTTWSVFCLHNWSQDYASRGFKGTSKGQEMKKLDKFVVDHHLWLSKLLPCSASLTTFVFSIGMFVHNLESEGLSLVSSFKTGFSDWTPSDLRSLLHFNIKYAQCLASVYMYIIYVCLFILICYLVFTHMKNAGSES